MSSTRYESESADPSPLAQPLIFANGRTTKNRFLKAPMAETLATWSTKNIRERGIPTEDLINLYRRWGEGKDNWGVIVTGNIDTQWETPNGPGDMLIGPDSEPEGERFDKFKALAGAAKAHGSLIVGQITHPGRQVQARINPEAVSASDIQLEPKMGMTFGKPHAATKREMVYLVEGFAHAAEYLEKAGFDGVELHAAHGYLISQFLSRTTNKRTDEYGPQSIENRLRFMADIIRAIKARVSPNFIVSAKLNSVEFQDGGMTADEAREVCEELEKLGLDFIELSGGTYEALGLEHQKESTKKREAFFIEFAESVAKALGPERKLKFYLVGGLRSTGAMVSALNVVDGVALGRPAAAEPRLASDIINGRVTGGIRPVASFQEDFGTGLVVAGTQISQVAHGHEPLSLADEETMKRWAQDMGAWYQKVVEDGAKMEFIRGVQYSGPQVAYGLSEA